MPHLRWLVAFLGCVLAVPTHAASFRFLSWGDSRVDGAATLAQCSQQVKQLPQQPQFTLFAGDLETSGFNSSEMATWWAAVNGDTTGATSNGIGSITFPVRGNHDAGNPSGWQSYFDVSAIASRVGATNYTSLATDLTWSFDYQNSHFVGIDIPGDFPALLTSAQLTWLDQDLAAAEQRGLTHAFLMWHGPLLTFTSSHYRDPNSTANHSLVDVLNRHPIVSAVLVGHEHIVAYAHVDAAYISNVTHEFEHFTHGASGASRYNMDAPIKPDAYLTDFGFATVDVVDGAFTVTWYAQGSATPRAEFKFQKALPVAATPTFSPPAGTYAQAQSVTLASATTGATLCYTIDGTTPAGASGSCTVGSIYTGPISVSGSRTIQAVATKGSTTTSPVASAAYVINPPPVISSFTASPASIAAGGSSTLSWSVTGATSLSISGIGTVTGASITVQPSVTTRYTLTAANANGSVSAPVTVTVMQPKPVINAFSASPSTITVGSSAKLSWSVTSAASLSISPTIGAVTGTSVSVKPPKTTTYTLTAANATGSVTATATVTVTKKK